MILMSFTGATMTPRSGQLQPIISSSASSPSAEAGAYLYATIWKDDELFLRQHDSGDLSLINQVSLGACS